MSETIRVHNKTNSAIEIRGKTVMIKNEHGLESPKPGDAHLLTTGVNTVPLKLFKEALGHKSVGKNGQKFSMLEAMRDEEKLDWDGDHAEAVVASKSIKELSEREAIRIVKETYSPDELASYRESDKRPGVQKAIGDQMKAGDEAIAKGHKDGKHMSDIDAKGS